MLPRATPLVSASALDGSSSLAADAPLVSVGTILAGLSCFGACSLSHSAAASWLLAICSPRVLMGRRRRCMAQAGDGWAVAELRRPHVQTSSQLCDDVARSPRACGKTRATAHGA